MGDRYLTTTISTREINSLVQCVESFIIPPRSNAKIPCKASKVSLQQKFERVLRFEPASKHHSDNNLCHAHDGVVVIDHDVKASGTFNIYMTKQNPQNYQDK